MKVPEGTYKLLFYQDGSATQTLPNKTTQSHKQGTTTTTLPLHTATCNSTHLTLKFKSHEFLAQQIYSFE
jgi:hypothetical protein